MRQTPAFFAGCVDAEKHERETTIDVTFEEQGPGRTKPTLRQNVSGALARRTGAYPGRLSMFDRLDGELRRRA